MLLISATIVVLSWAFYETAYLGCEASCEYNDEYKMQIEFNKVTILESYQHHASKIWHIVAMS